MKDQYLVAVRWRLLPEGDSDWQRRRALYAYVQPSNRELLYIGKAWGVSIKGRWYARDKDKIRARIHEERRLDLIWCMVGTIEYTGNLSRQLLQDIESLLIREMKPPYNTQCIKSRGYSRPNLKLKCVGAWTYKPRIFLDE